MTKEELKTYIENNFAGKLTILESGKYDLFFEVSADNLVTVCQLLKDDAELHFDYLCNISGFDTGEQFGAVYDIASSTKKLRLDLKVNLSHENPELDSIQTVWKAANWYEREMWELYGINITLQGDTVC